MFMLLFYFILVVVVMCCSLAVARFFYVKRVVARLDRLSRSYNTAARTRSHNIR